MEVAAVALKTQGVEAAAVDLKNREMGEGAVDHLLHPEMVGVVVEQLHSDPDQQRRAMVEVVVELPLHLGEVAEVEVAGHCFEWHSGPP